MEPEIDGCLPFLDVLINKDLPNYRFLTSVYRKETFTGCYMRYESFCNKNRKFALIKNLTHRAHMICSKETLKSELERLEELFLMNGYPEYLVKKLMYQPRREPLLGPAKCPVYIKLPFIGRNSYRFANLISRCVDSTFHAVVTKPIFSSQSNFPKMVKDRLPTLSNSNIIYKFTCYCDSSYVGKTTQTFRKRIAQHVPPCMQKFIAASKENAVESLKKITIKQTLNAVEKSAICKHLYENKNCMLNFNMERFKIIEKARNSFHLDVLESVFISVESPILCRQKEFVYRTLLF